MSNVRFTGKQGRTSVRSSRVHIGKLIERLPAGVHPRRGELVRTANPV